MKWCRMRCLVTELRVASCELRVTGCRGGWEHGLNGYDGFNRIFRCFYSGLLLLFFSSCSLNTTKNLREVSCQETTFENSYFSNPEKDYVYKAKIEAFGKFFGGILVVKKLKEEHHRIAFTTEFGAKIFDFEFEKNNFKVNYVVEALDKKMVIKNLRKNFQLLVKESFPVYKKYVDADYSVYQARHNKQHYFYFFSKESGLLEKMVQTSKTKEKVVVLFEAKESQFAYQVQIVHQKMPLKIDLQGF